MSTRLQCEMAVGRKFIAIEFHGNGDPFFGGGGDDRPFGNKGEFLSGHYLRTDVAEFSTEKEAREAVTAAPRRVGSLVGFFERG